MGETVQTLRRRADYRCGAAKGKAPPPPRRPRLLLRPASERDAKSDKGAELGMIRIKKVEEVRSELASPLWENEEGQLPEERRKA